MKRSLETPVGWTGEDVKPYRLGPWVSSAAGRYGQIGILGEPFLAKKGSPKPPPKN